MHFCPLRNSRCGHQTADRESAALAPAAASRYRGAVTIVSCRGILSSLDIISVIGEQCVGAK